MATKKKKPRSLKQDLIWKSGGMLGHLGCGKTNIETAELQARQLLSKLREVEEDQEAIKDLETLRIDLVEVCLELNSLNKIFTRVLHDIYSAAQEKINRIPANDNTPSL